MKELEPCPFCGCEVEVEYSNYTNLHAGEGFKIVGYHDDECFFTMLSYILFYESEEEAIDAWNRRINNV